LIDDSTVNYVPPTLFVPAATASEESTPTAVLPSTPSKLPVTPSVMQPLTPAASPATPQRRNLVTPPTVVSSEPLPTESTVAPPAIPLQPRLEEIGESKESEETEQSAPRRSMRYNKGMKPDRLGYSYANDKENAWRKKHGMSVMTLIKDGMEFVVGVKLLQSITSKQYLRAANADTPDFEIAIRGKDAEKWLRAMNIEIANLEERGTWEPAVLPPDRKMVGCKWVFRIKRDDKSRITKFKARLTAQGFSQIFGLDFGETFAPTIRAETWRTVFAIAAEIGPSAKLFQWDIVGAYLWADLKEEIYMRCPHGCKLPRGMNCLRLKKALYGLKQAGRCWYQLLKKLLLDEGFNVSEDDPCLFIHHGVDVKLTLLCLHVDDLFGFTTERSYLNKVRQRLDDEFDLQDLGEPSFILGIHIVQDKVTGAITLHQERYVREMLEKFNMSNCNPVRNPADPSVVLCTEDDSELLAKDVPYREAVGALLYASINTLPAISFAVNRVAKFVEAPRESHWTAVKRIFRFLKGIQQRGIVYKKTSGKPVLTMYCDADYATDIDTRKSTTGYVAFIAGGPVAWRSTTQKGTALSTCVAELYALTEATSHAIWHRNLLAGIGFNQCAATTVFEDNQAAIAVCENDVVTRRIKCVGVRLSFLRDQVNDDVVDLVYVASEENTADIFTKALTVVPFEFHAQRLGLSN